MKRKSITLSEKEKLRVIENITKIVKSREEITFAYLYGSFLEKIPFHDIDIGVYLTGIEKERYTSFGLDLSDVLSAETEFPIDIRVLNVAPISFVYHVYQGNLICERDEIMRAQIVEEAVRKYLDIKPIIFQGIKEAFAL